MKVIWKYAITTLIGVGATGGLTCPVLAVNQLQPISELPGMVLRNPVQANTEGTDFDPDPLPVGRRFYASGRFSAAISAWQTAIEKAQVQGDDRPQAIALSYLSLAH